MISKETLDCRGAKTKLYLYISSDEPVRVFIEGSDDDKDDPYTIIIPQNGYYSCEKTFLRANYEWFNKKGKKLTIILASEQRGSCFFLHHNDPSSPWNKRS